MTVLQAANSRQPRTTAEPPGGSGNTRNKRSPRYVLLGVLLILVGAVAFWVTSVKVDPRTPVLALARPVAVGHVLTDADLQVVRIVPDPVLQAVPQTQRSTVVGRSVREPLAADTLLSQAMLGPAAWPPAGQSLIAMPVKAGHAPAGLAAGAQVLVLVVPSASISAGSSATAAGGGASGAQQARGAVVAVAAPDSTGASVVSLLVSSSDAVRIVSASGDVSLVVQGGAG